MIPIKIVLTTNKKILNIAISNYNLEKIINEYDLDIYEWNLAQNEETEKIVFARYDINNIELLFQYISENYIYQKIVEIDDSKIFLNFELKSGDIVIPNTFISLKDENKAFFYDIVIWENYDLLKFWLVLNGICLSVWDKKVDDLQDLKEDFYADIIDKNSYDLIEKNTLLNNDSVFSSIKIVVSEDDEFIDEYYLNAFNILDLIY